MTTTNVVFPIGIELVEDFLRTRNKLEYPVSVWACGIDEPGEFLLIVPVTSALWLVTTTMS